MAQFNLYVHGVPIGHEVCPRDAEEDYLKDFYSHDKEIKETSFMQIDIVNAKSFYTYLHKKNVSSEIGRPGSYLGLTVCFSKQYCTNVYMLYEILETIYQKICIGCLIKQESGNERFLVKEIASAQFKGSLAVDYIKAAFKQNMEKYLSNNIEDLDGFSNSVGEAKFSLKEVDSPLFHETLKRRRILVSPEYGTLSAAYNNLRKEVVPLKEEYGRFKQDNTQLREKNKKLTDEVERLEKELSNAESSADKKFKKQLEEIQAKCDEVKKEKKELENKIREAASAIELIDLPVKTLTCLFMSKFPEESKKGHKKDDKPCPPRNSENPPKAWQSLVNLILLVCILVLCCYGCRSLSKLLESTAVKQNQEQANIAGEANEIRTMGTETDNPLQYGSHNYDDYSKCKIDIVGWNGKGSLLKGNTYSLQVKKGEYPANVPTGEWIETTSPEKRAGIIITGNEFCVDSTVTNKKTVQISYVVKSHVVIQRTITVE